MNHKRKRPKNRRCGCLMCKPQKMNGFGKNKKDSYKIGVVRARFAAIDAIKESLTNDS